MDDDPSLGRRQLDEPPGAALVVGDDRCPDAPPLVRQTDEPDREHAHEGRLADHEQASGNAAVRRLDDGDVAFPVDGRRRPEATESILGEVRESEEAGAIPRSPARKPVPHPGRGQT